MVYNKLHLSIQSISCTFGRTYVLKTSEPSDFSGKIKPLVNFLSSIILGFSISSQVSFDKLYFSRNVSLCLNLLTDSYS